MVEEDHFLTESDEPQEEAPVIILSTLAALVDAALAVEKIRVRSQVRQTHLTLDGRSDEETDNLVTLLTDVEGYIDGRVALHIKTHPAYPWFSKVKGVGQENIAKVVAQVDIRKATTISALWRFCGYAVVDGHSERRVKGGGKLHYNSQLRTMCFRLGNGLLRAGLRHKCPECGTLSGKTACPECGHDMADAQLVTVSKFAAYFLAQKIRYQESFAAKGIKIVPAAQLPKKNGKRAEGDGFISEGHCQNMALRRVIKLFLSCLWLAWRTAEGLPITAPYAVGVLGHEHQIGPWDMTDR